MTWRSGGCQIDAGCLPGCPSQTCISCLSLPACPVQFSHACNMQHALSHWEHAWCTGLKDKVVLQGPQAVQHLRRERPLESLQEM